MKVHFIYTETKTYDMPNAQLGIEILSAVLKKEGHETSLSHIWQKVDKKKLVLDIKKEKPALLAFTSNSLEFPTIKRLALFLKKEFNLPIIVGGYHATLSPDEVIQNEGIDMLCVGEGEYALLELVEALQQNKDITKISNLWVKKDGQIFRNLPRPLISDLDSLPFPDHSLFDYQWILGKNYGTVKIMASRGCPFACTFCCNNALKKIYSGKGKFLRRRSVENLLKEIEELVKDYKVKTIEFEDDLFAFEKKWLLEFCREYPKKFNLPFTIEARADSLDKEMLVELKEAGCWLIRFGVESGNEWLRNSVLKKRLTNERIKQTFEGAKEAGIKRVAYNIIGFPYETEAMILDTWNFNREVDPDILVINIFQPFLGTELYNLCLRKGYFKKEKASDLDFKKATISSPLISKKKLYFYFEKFDDWMLESSLRTLHTQLYPFYKIAKFLLGKNTKRIFRKLRDYYAQFKPLHS